MKKIFITFIAISVFYSSFSQAFGDREILITLEDTTNLYEKVENAFIKHGFTIRNNNKDTLITHTKSIFNPFGYAFLKAVLNGKLITIMGWYRQTAIGENYENKEDPETEKYKPIIYFYNSSTWRIMNKVAQELKNKKNIKEKKQADVQKKSKEARLRELKDLFEKELITKEEYEKAKQKILDEDE